VHKFRLFLALLDAWHQQPEALLVKPVGLPQPLERHRTDNVLNGAKRLNDWNAWNGLIPVVNGAQRLNVWNGWNWLLFR
jgi:hypothetical protein